MVNVGGNEGRILYERKPILADAHASSNGCVREPVKDI